MAGLGWLGMGLPEACGGLPSSLADLYAFYLEMGRNLVDVPHLETVVVAGGLIAAAGGGAHDDRSEEPTSELQSLMRRSSAVFCFNKKKPRTPHTTPTTLYTT